jgi:hypothetical protein
VARLQGLIEEALRSIEAINTQNLESAQAAAHLADCGQTVQVALIHFMAEPCSFERLTELSEIEQRIDNPWNDWAGNVRLELERCLKEFLAVQSALSLCWLVLAEEFNRQRVQVQNTNISPQINLPIGQIQGNNAL